MSRLYKYLSSLTEWVHNTAISLMSSTIQWIKIKGKLIALQQPQHWSYNWVQDHWEGRCLLFAVYQKRNTPFNSNQTLLWSLSSLCLYWRQYCVVILIINCVECLSSLCSTQFKQDFYYRLRKDKHMTDK